MSDLERNYYDILAKGIELYLACPPSSHSTDCPNDSAFEHTKYYGCMPKDFNYKTGRSKTYEQERGRRDRVCRWNGGCDASRLPHFSSRGV
jgi:hypothetical protein